MLAVKLPNIRVTIKEDSKFRIIMTTSHNLIEHDKNNFWFTFFHI